MLKLLSIKFLVDESVEYGIVLFLRNLDFDVVSISEENPSILDPEVLKVAYQQKRVLITNDKGFSRLVFKEKHKSYGVILIRMPYKNTREKILILNQVIKSNNALEKLFTTMTDKQTRSKPLPK